MRARPRFVAVLLLVSLSLACGDPPTREQAEALSLAPGATFSRTLTGAGPLRFRFEAEADHYLHLDVEQRGIDVVALLRDPAGGLLLRMDRPTGDRGTEMVLAVTPARGEYLLTLEPLAPEAKGGLILRVRAARPARGEDRARAAAVAKLAQAERQRLAGGPQPSAAAYREALPHLQASGLQPLAADAEWRLGEALLRSGELRPAAASLERAAARYRDLRDPAGEARALNNLGDAFRRLGEPARALPAYQRSLELYRAAGVERGEASALNDIGLALEITGDLEGAIGWYEKALAVWRRLGSRSSEAATLQNLGSLYILIGHDAEGLDLLRQALDRLAGDKDESRRASALIALGWAEYLTGRPEQALGRYQEALALARRSGNRLAQAGAWDRRGSALRALRRFDEAAVAYSRALALSRAAGSRSSEGHTLANLGWLDLETGEARRARQRLRRALELLEASGDPNGVVYVRTGLSRAERQLGALGPAQDHAESAIRLVEEMRTGLRGSASRGHFLATRYDAYEELATLLMALDRREPAAGHARKAMEVAERARARNLLEDLGTTSTPSPHPLAPSPIPSRPPGEGEESWLSGEWDGGREGVGEGPGVRGLRTEIQALEERRQAFAARDPQDPRIPGLDAALRARWLELDRLQAARRPSAAPPLTASEIQALADEETLLVVYLLAEPASFAWTVDRESVTSHVLPGGERIERLARRVVAAMPRSHEVAARGSVERAARALSAAILAPLEKRLAGRKRLAILADGALHLVPFAALPAPSRSPGEPAAPLLLRHEIAMVPSATVLQAQRRRLAGRPPAPGVVAVLADPVFSRDDERLSGSRGRRAAGSRGLDPGPLPRLPFTAEEAAAITNLVPREQALLAVGPAASRDLVLSGGLRRHRIVHFATHGLLHPVLPERSGLVLSRFDAQGERRNGFLSAPDVAALDLPAELAVLSACETGLGREMRGEGLVGLTQAFFRAGARRVVVSTWKVRDRTTAALMARFYRNLLAEDLPPTAALRAAQLAIRDEPRWRSPYFWAGFSLHGDWR